MIWIGNSNGSTSSSDVWKPDSSFPKEEFAIDFDKINSNIRDLNLISGEGCPQVTHTPKGAELKVYCKHWV